VTDARGRLRVGAIAWLIAATVPLSTLEACSRRGDSVTTSSSSTVLRVGVAQLSLANPTQGLRQVSQILAVESLARPGEDGRMQPLLAEAWTRSGDGRPLTVKLRPHVRFHDGSPLDAKILSESLRSFMGNVFSDIDYVRASDTDSIEIGFKGAPPFLIEALEAPVQKPGTTVVATGPFMVAENTTELRANADYYQGRPVIDRVTVSNYPNARAAWAEMLRNRLDMLWEVGSDALDSMKNSKTVSLFTYTRHYQHVIVFNTNALALRSPDIRRALNFAVDRGAVVRSALRDRGVASSSPVAPRYWALPRDSQQFDFDPQRAAELLGRSRRKAVPLHFTCLVAPDSVGERIALEIKQQLAAVGVNMSVQEASRDEIVRRAGNREFEAAVIEMISGPTLLRPYLIWHSQGPLNWGHFGSANTDEALERVRHAPSEDTYRQAVAGLQQAFIDDPPAIFLAWSVSTRAVSKRFDVQAEEGRDVLSTLRLWKPIGLEQQASRN
jgi:peptide/nickel transport system substrate-binding protein